MFEDYKFIIIPSSSKLISFPHGSIIKNIRHKYSSPYWFLSWAFTATDECCWHYWWRNHPLMSASGSECNDIYLIWETTNGLVLHMEKKWGHNRLICHGVLIGKGLISERRAHLGHYNCCLLYRTQLLQWQSIEWGQCLSKTSTAPLGVYKEFMWSDPLWPCPRSECRKL